MGGRWRTPLLLAALVVLFVALTLAFTRGGDETPAPDADGTTPSPTRVAAADLDPDATPLEAALTLIPADAQVATVTDLDALRARFGVPDLTSDDLMTDRFTFWERARTDAVLLTDGLLRADNSLFELDHGFTEDDVDWEARWTGPAGAGWALAFRPDQPMEEVQGAVDEVELLEGAEVNGRLLTLGAAPTPRESWAASAVVTAALGDAADERAESTYLRQGCVPLADALGPDATVETQDQVLAHHDIAAFDPLDLTVVDFRDGVGTARFAADRTDLFDRAALLADWPSEGAYDVGPAFGDDPVVDPGTGRIGLTVTSPPAAGRLTLGDVLPFAVCDEVVPMDEPTGL